MTLRGLKSLIIYFSKAGENYFNGDIKAIEVGNTEIIANYIQEITDADMFKVETVNEYPFGYDETTKIAKEEFQKKDRPKLKEELDNIEDYEVIYIGFPNWWGTLPMAMFTQLEKLNFIGKIIMPFVTHEGSGFGTSRFDLEELCEGGNVRTGLSVYGHDVKNSKSAVDNWIE